MSENKTLLVRAVHSNGRRLYDAASKRRLVAACLEPGVSVSRLALEHGVNANLLRKWIKNAAASGEFAPLSPPAFIPVQVAGGDRSRALLGDVVDMHVTRGDDRALALQRIAPLASPAKVSAVLPNGVKLTLEAGDSEALATIIGAFGNVQTGR